MESPHTNGSGKIGHFRNLAQKWPSESVFMLVHNDDHPHPRVDAALPTRDSSGEVGSSCRWPRLGFASFHELVRTALGLRHQRGGWQNLRALGGGGGLV